MKVIESKKLIKMIESVVRVEREISPERLIEYIENNSNEVLEEFIKKPTRKIVINTKYGGFGLSEKAKEYLGYGFKDYINDKIRRDDPKLVECVENLGQEAADSYCHLAIIEIPFDVDWVIEEYDGLEWVSEKRRIWGSINENICSK